MSLLFGPNLDQLLFCPGAFLGNTISYGGWFYSLSLGEVVGTEQLNHAALIWHENTTTDARPRSYIGWTVAGQINFFSDATGVDPDSRTNTAAMSLNNWVWVGMTWNVGMTDKPIFYARNGDGWAKWSAHFGTATWSNPTGSLLGVDGYNLRIGNNSRLTQCFHGYIAETYAWTRILTEEQMRSVAFDGPNAHLQNIYFWYNPNEPLTPTALPYTGTTPDRSGNGRTGVTLGSPVFAAFEPAPRPAIPTKPGRFGPQIVV